MVGLKKKGQTIFRLQTIQDHTVNFTFLRTKYFENLKFPRNNLCKNENIQREYNKNYPFKTLKKLEIMCKYFVSISFYAYKI